MTRIRYTKSENNNYTSNVSGFVVTYNSVDYSWNVSQDNGRKSSGIEKNVAAVKKSIKFALEAFGVVFEKETRNRMAKTALAAKLV